MKTTPVEVSLPAIFIQADIEVKPRWASRPAYPAAEYDQGTP